MLTPDDRARCAAALRPASVETLMQWAEWANANAGVEDRHGSFAAVDRWAGLAALALAAARLQEMSNTGARMSADADGAAFATDDGRTVEGGRTLPAALAALVERDA